MADQYRIVCRLCKRKIAYYQGSWHCKMHGELVQADVIREKIHFDDIRNFFIGGE